MKLLDGRKPLAMNISDSLAFIEAEQPVEEQVHEAVPVNLPRKVSGDSPVLVLEVRTLLEVVNPTPPEPFFGHGEEPGV